MSWAVIRNWSPLLRTEPSSTLATCSCRAISGISAPLPLNEKDDVRAATLSCGIFDSKLSNSSEMPSEKYSLVLSSLRSEEHTSELQSQSNLVCRLLLEY